MNEFVKISVLSPAPDPLSGGELLAVVQADMTYKLLSRSLVLPIDPLLTYIDCSATLPGSKKLSAGVGISLGSSPTEITISASSSGNLTVLDLIVDAVLPTALENWNPTGWASGLLKNRLQVTPAATLLLGGLDSSGAEDGQIVALINDSGSFNLRLAHNSGASLVGNRFFCPGGATFALVPYQMVLLIKKGTSGWRFA